MTSGEPNRPRLRDVAALAGVSQGTASNAFNRPELVKPELRRLGYQGPAPAGRALRSGKAHLLALVTEETLDYVMGDHYAQRLLRGIAVVCDRVGSGIAVVSLASGRASGWSIETAIADGFILHCMAINSPLTARARRRGLPFVAVDTGPLEAVATVNIDDRQAAETAARHLLEQGHRRLGVLSLDLAGDGRTGPVDASREAGLQHATTAARLAGYRAACAAFGIDAGDLPVFEAANERAATVAAVEALFGDDNVPAARRPTGLLAMSDKMALIAIEALRGLGLAVPKDVSVIGIDDIEAAAHADPPLTTIHQPILEKGRIAAEMLLKERPMESVTLATELRRRGSTAPPGRD